MRHRRPIADALRALLAVAVLVAASAPAQAAGDAEAPSIFWEAFNFILLLVVLVFLARKPVLAFMAQRRGRIQEEIEAARQLLADADARLDEWSGKTARLDSDIAEIRQLTRERAERERARILEDADFAAERVRRDAESAVERELGRARKALREEASDLAVELAGKLLAGQVTDADRARLVDEFVTRIESAGSGDGKGGNGAGPRAGGA